MPKKYLPLYKTNAGEVGRCIFRYNRTIDLEFLDGRMRSFRTEATTRIRRPTRLQIREWTRYLENKSLLARLI